MRTIYLAGDSTAAQKTPDVAPETGWGMALPSFLHEGFVVDNRATNGRSTKSFIDEGRLASILETIQPGDILLIQFGHNDEKIEDPTRYCEPWTAYQDNLRQYVDAARVRGALPVLATPVERRNFDSAGTAEYNVAPYTLDLYLLTYDPAHWTGPATGPMEDARKASSAKQAERVRVNIGANTTLIGLDDAYLTGFSLNVESVQNVIVRNLHISDAYDCFPGWNGETWKTEWDNLVVSRSTHVWLDHLTLDDGDTVDTEQPKYFGEPFLRHDGLLDVVRQADLVTISWNKLNGHDKSMLLGNGDGVVADRGKIRVTMHHNEFTGLVQRAPRVRFGQAHVYNNLYRVTDKFRYGYSWGVGVESSIIARDNWFELTPGVTADRIIYDWGGTGITESGNWVNGRQAAVLDVYNAAHPDDQLLPTVSGSSGPHLRIDPAPSVPAAVGAWAGAGRL